MDYQAEKNLLANKTILVTGAGDGIGRQAALTYATHGATVILLGKTVAKLEAVYDEIEALGAPTPAIIPLDMKGATVENYKDMADTIDAQFGKLDGLLNNAGQLGVLGPFHQIDEKSYDEVMQVNVKAQLFMTSALLPVLKKADKASILFTSSSVGVKGRAYWAEYAISKFATEGMMQTLADEFENTNVRANCINPGATRTGMRAKAFPGEDEKVLLTPEQIMPLYLYLMGNDSVAETGKTFKAQPNR
jgi:NAD(P)-dependent dehydrogenase (short-subunit alcohol dehydrogenase family)